jgi:hypothetical protein
MPKVSTSYKPGQSGNPNGRPPKEWTMTALYKEALDESLETGESKKVIVARKLVEKAMEGDVVAIKEINNRIDGMAVQTVDQHTDGELKITIIDDNKHGEE